MFPHSAALDMYYTQPIYYSNVKLLSIHVLIELLSRNCGQFADIDNTFNLYQIYHVLGYVWVSV